MKGFVFFVLAILPLLSYGQTEPADSVDIDLLPDNPEMMTSRLEGMASGINLDSLSYSRRLFLYGPGHRFDYGAPELKYAPGETTLFAMPGARFIATGATTTMPGLMTVNSGAIGITGQIDNLSLYAGAIANKYGYYLGVHNQYGVNATMSYAFSPDMSATLFGSYYFGNPPALGDGLPLPPAMIGYYATSKFGGYMDYRINERFGVMVGAQAVQRVGTRRYEAEPIVTPYVSFGKVQIELPVGQILNGILRDYVIKKH